MFLGGWALVICPIVALSTAHVRCVELHVVESVDEVGPELQLEPFGKLEVLMQTEVDVVKCGDRSHPSRCRAISESSNCRYGEVIHHW